MSYQMYFIYFIYVIYYGTNYLDFGLKLFFLLLITTKFWIRQQSIFLVENHNDK